MLVETIEKSIGKYLEAGNAAEALGKSLLCKYELPDPKASLVQRRLWTHSRTKARSTCLDPHLWQPVLRKMQPWQQRLALCTKYRLVWYPKAVLRRSEKVVSHVEPTTVLAVEPTELGTTSFVSWAVKCQGVPPDLAERKKETVENSS